MLILMNTLAIQILLHTNQKARLNQSIFSIRFHNGDQISKLD